MTKAGLAYIASLSLCFAPSAWSHHSFAAQYDADQPITLRGVVTRVEWTNPHARFYIDVADENGDVVNWNLELASPNVLGRRGWSRDFVKPGDEITVEGSLARDGSKMANALAVSLADGTRIMSRD
jgi:hypothetical protein